MKSLLLVTFFLFTTLAHADQDLMLPLKSPKALASYLKANPQEVAEILRRKKSQMAEPYNTELKKLDLSNIDAAVEKQYVFLRTLYFQDVLFRPLLNEVGDSFGNFIFAIEGVNGFTMGIDENGDIVLGVTLRDQKYIPAIAETLAQNISLVNFLGAARFTFEVSPDVRLQ